MKFKTKQEAIVKWQEYCAKGKGMVKSMRGIQIEIAELAIEACDIVYGGGNHWSQFKSLFTLKEFAKEIGISYKTLHDWTRIKRQVIDKLEKGTYNPVTDFTTANNTLKRIGQNHNSRNVNKSLVQNMFNEDKQDNGLAIKLKGLLSRLKSGKQLLYNNRKIVKGKVSQNELRMIKVYSQGIIDEIELIERSGLSSTIEGRI